MLALCSEQILISKVINLVLKIPGEQKLLLVLFVLFQSIVLGPVRAHRA